MYIDFKQLYSVSHLIFHSAGKDLTNVQNLQKKHQALMVSY